MTTLNLANVRRRDAQGAGDNYAPVWDGRRNDRVGSFISREIANRMTESGTTLVLQKVDGEQVDLATADDWGSFVAKFLKRDGGTSASDREHIEKDPQGLVAQFGMSYENLCFALDDAASQVKSIDNPDGLTGERIELLPGGEWDAAANIYAGAADSYGLNLDGNKTVSLAASGNLTVELVAAPKINADILGATMSFTRERLETEEQYEVVVRSGRDDNIFRDLSGNEVFQALDVTKLGPYQENNGIAHIWQDDTAANVFEQFPYPMHLEVDRDDSTGYQINRSPFIEGFVDTDDMKLLNSGQMLRFRWRPEQAGRTNIQGKQDQGRDQNTGLVNQRKFEHRSPSGSTGTGPNEEALHMDLMESMAIQGKIGLGPNAQMSSVHREVYQGLIDAGAIAQGDSITLSTKIVSHQERRRTHLIFYSKREMESLKQTLESNKAEFDTLTANASAGDKAKWGENLDQMLTKVDDYIAKIEKRDTLISKYGERVSTSFDGLIISRDQKTGFEAGSFGNGSGIWPAGRRGQPAHWVRNSDGDFAPRIIDGADRIDPLGDPILRAESELDSNVSTPIDEAVILCYVTAGRPDDVLQNFFRGVEPDPDLRPRQNIDAAEAAADLPELITISNDMRLCTRSAMDLQAAAYEAAGLEMNRQPTDSTFQRFGKELQAQGSRGWHNLVSIRNAPITPPPPPPTPTPTVNTLMETSVDIGMRQTAEFDVITIPDDGRSHKLTIDIERTGFSDRGRVNDVDLYVNIGEPPKIDARNGRPINADLALVDDPKVPGDAENGTLDVPAGSKVFITAWGRGKINTANVSVTSD